MLFACETVQTTYFQYLRKEKKGAATTNHLLPFCSYYFFKFMKKDILFVIMPQ